MPHAKEKLIPDESTLAESLRKRMALAERRVLIDESEQEDEPHDHRFAFRPEPDAPPAPGAGHRSTPYEGATARLTSTQHSEPRGMSARAVGNVVLKEVPGHAAEPGIDLHAYRSPMFLAYLLVVVLAIQAGYFVAALMIPSIASTAAWAPLENLVFAFTAVAFVAWTYRLYANLASFVATGISTKPSVAAVLLAIPVVNLIAPPILFHEIWCAADPSVGVRVHDWRRGAADAILALWWLTFIGAVCLRALPMFPTPWSTAPVLPLITHLAFALAGILGVASVWRISIRQEDKHWMLTSSTGQLS